MKRKNVSKLGFSKEVHCEIPLSEVLKRFPLRSQTQSRSSRDEVVEPVELAKDLGEAYHHVLKWIFLVKVLSVSRCFNMDLLGLTC